MEGAVPSDQAFSTALIHPESTQNVPTLSSVSSSSTIPDALLQAIQNQGALESQLTFPSSEAGGAVASSTNLSNLSPSSLLMVCVWGGGAKVAKVFFESYKRLFEAIRRQSCVS